MSQFTSEDEALIQSMLRQLLQSVKKKISGASSAECAEKILLHLEETDENFHNYEFVKYLRQYISNTLGSVIEEESEKCTSAQNRSEVSGYDTVVQHIVKKTRESKQYREMMHALKNVMTVVVESLINKFEEDQMCYTGLDSKAKKKYQSDFYTDNYSDSDSSFSQVNAFSLSVMNLCIISGIFIYLGFSAVALEIFVLFIFLTLQVRLEALQTLCLAPPSDVLNSECWPNLRKHLMMSLSDPDAVFSEKILRFYAKTFSSSPFSMTRKVYTSLAQHLKYYFLSGEYSLRISSGLDVSNTEINHILKKVRLLNEYQKEAPSSWIRYPEKYMEKIVESTLSLLSVKHDPNHPVSPDFLSPIYFLALLDIKAVWFKKWTINAAVQQCLDYFEFCKAAVSKTCRVNDFSQEHSNNEQKFFYTESELQYMYFVHSLCLLGRLLIYKQGRNLFPVQLKTRKGKREGNEFKTFLASKQVYINCLETTLIDVADILARIAAAEDGLSVLLYGGNKNSVKEDCPTAAQVIAQFTKKLLQDDISLLSGSELLQDVKGAYIFVCRQMYRTCEGLQMLIPYGLHESIGEAWRKVNLVLDWEV
ncbi:UNVERIFIED_CONTAM: hypothetical protein H355_006472 [Colinus virginianus]|nr:hypothetical protein H355_006472 [Colinus virginianus]